MKYRLRVVVLCLQAFMLPVAVAQAPRAPRAGAAAEPPSLPLHAFTNANPPDEVIVRVLAFEPVKPLGPADVLKGYEVGMAMIAERLTTDLISISLANRANQITLEEAEYLIQDRYQIAMMQHEVLSALHESLEHELLQAAKHPIQSDTAVNVKPRSAGQVLTQ